MVVSAWLTLIHQQAHSPLQLLQGNGGGVASLFIYFLALPVSG